MNWRVWRRLEVLSGKQAIEAVVQYLPVEKWCQLSELGKAPVASEPKSVDGYFIAVGKVIPGHIEVIVDSFGKGDAKPCSPISH